MDGDSGMEDNINLLLTGRVGVGKSATGNSILGFGRTDFKTSNSETLQPTVPMKRTSTESGNTVTVVDGIDVYDKHDINILKERANTIFTMLSGGITAFIFVYRNGDQFTNQERDAVKVIRSIFGEDVLKTRGVVVISHGDNFLKDHEDLNFDEWIASQTGGFKDTLIEDCGSRIVLFDNRAGPERMRKQQEELMSKVIEIKSTSRPYTMEDMNKSRGHARQNAGSGSDENKLTPDARQNAGSRSHENKLTPDARQNAGSGSDENKLTPDARQNAGSGSDENKLMPDVRQNAGSGSDENKLTPDARQNAGSRSDENERTSDPTNPYIMLRDPGRWCSGKCFAMYSLCLIVVSAGITFLIYWLYNNGYFNN